MRLQKITTIPTAINIFLVGNLEVSMAEKGAVTIPPILGAVHSQTLLPRRLVPKLPIVAKTFSKFQRSRELQRLQSAQRP